MLVKGSSNKESKVDKIKADTSELTVKASFFKEWLAPPVHNKRK